MARRSFLNTKLCLSLFPQASFRQRKGGIKLHTVLDHDGPIPAFVTISETRTHENRDARTLELPMRIQLCTALTVYLFLAYQKFLSRIGVSIQPFFQPIQINLFGSFSLDELLNPRRRKTENTYDFSLLEFIP